jgi:hypothetical protein
VLSRGKFNMQQGQHKAGAPLNRGKEELLCVIHYISLVGVGLYVA